MTFDPGASTRLHEVVEDITAKGVTDLFAELVRTVWSTNVARYDRALGDTIRVIAIQSSENIAQLLAKRAATDDRWKACGVRVSLRNNSVLIEIAGFRIHFVKAPSSSGLAPDWSRDFDWEATSGVRAAAASSNDATYHAPQHEVGIDPLIGLDGLGAYGDPSDLREFFVVWGGVVGEQPLTAGWLIVPSLATGNVAAAERIWTDDETSGNLQAKPNEPGPAPTGYTEPEVHLRLRPSRGTAAPVG